MKRTAVFIVIWLFVLTAVQGYSQPITDPVTKQILDRLGNGGSTAKIHIGSDTLQAVTALYRFYAERGFRLAWVDRIRGPLPVSTELLHAISQADFQGLDPKDYHLQAIETMIAKINAFSPHVKTEKDFETMADADLLMTDAYLLYAKHLMIGRINPETIDPGWGVHHRKIDPAGILEEALRSGNITASLMGLPPHQIGYGRLKLALAQYQAAAKSGGWPPVFAGKKLLKKGNTGPVIAALRKRLMASGDLVGTVPAGRTRYMTFDSGLVQGVKAFQRRHGLEPDGIVGKNTLAALNTPIEDRIRQIKLNLERWRWLPRNQGNPHIEVNIADFRLDVIKDDQSVLNMRVVVGKPFAQTPVFSAWMTYLVFSPFWSVPQSIAKDELLPEIRKNPDFLKQNNMELLKGWGKNETVVDPADVDWNAVTPDHFPFHIRQRPGGDNPLGKVKFMLPNPFEVYLHDTSAPGLFTHTTRTFSHGCMRIDKPLALAEYLLQGSPEWTPEAITAAMNRGIEQIVSLPRPIQVHVVYTTAWVDEEGRVQFRPDIYGRDERLAAVFFNTAPVPLRP